MTLADNSTWASVAEVRGSVGRCSCRGRLLLRRVCGSTTGEGCLERLESRLCGRANGWSGDPRVDSFSGATRSSVVSSFTSS